MDDKVNRPAERLPSLFGGASPFKSLHDEMDRMFHAFSLPQMSWRSAPAVFEGVMGLRVDIGETDNEIQIKADLPGVPASDLDVTLEDDMLRIRAEKKSESETSEKNWRLVERSYGRFERAIQVPRGIDPDKIDAHSENGVLTITLPKPAEAKETKRRIDVKKTD